MRIRLNIFILLIILLTSCGPAVLPTPIESQVLPEPTTAQIIDPIVWPGLNDGWMTFSKSSPVYKVVLDESGYLWGIRFSDVLRWSAKTGEVIQFTVEMGNLPFNATRIEAFQGNIWIASNNGEIAVFLNDEWVIQRISVGRLYLISVVKDDLWVVGEESAYYFNGNDWNEFLPLRTRDNRWIRQVVKSNDGSLWFLDSESVVSRYNNLDWQIYDNLSGVNSIVETSNGLLWFFFYDLIVSFDGVDFVPQLLNEEFFRYSIGSYYLDNNMNAIINTSKGWFSTSSSSLIEIDRPEYFSLSLQTPLGLTKNDLIFFSENKILVYENDTWRDYFLPPDNPITQMVENSVIGFTPDGYLWTHNAVDGFVKYDGGHASSPFQNDNKNFNIIRSRIDRYGNIWFISSGGTTRIVHYSPKEKRGIIFELSNLLTDFVLDNSGNVWVAFEDGFIAKFNPDDKNNKVIWSGENFYGFTWVPIEKIKIGENPADLVLKPTQIEIDSKGKIIVFTDPGGLYSYVEDRWAYIGLSGQLTYGISTHFAIGPKDEIWVAFSDHIVMYDGKNWNSYRQDGISINSITVTRNGIVWVTTNDLGLFSFDGETWVNYADINGVPLTDLITIPKIIEAPDGALWFMNYFKWTRYNP